MKLIAISKNSKKKSEVIGITNDGWVLTKDGAFGDLNVDCSIELTLGGFLKEFREKNNLTQQEVAWIMGASRASYIGYEKDKVEMTLKQFLLLSHYIPENMWTKMRKQIIK